MTELTSPRILDHLVLPVADIDEARARYSQLGFTVAPNGVHPFGTENCCVFFADGTFLEPLGIAHRETCEAHAREGNTFVRNDQTYRFRRGIEGFSHMVLKSDDARADDKLYREKGLSGGPMVPFSRAFETPEGETGEVSFELAFAADPRAPDAGFFTCQVKNAPNVDRSALQSHANGVVGLKEVILSEVNPTDFQYFFQTFLNQREMDVDSFGMSFDIQGSRVSVFSPDGMRTFFHMDAERKERGLRFAAVVLQVADLATLCARLNVTKIKFEERAGKVFVGPSAGQGLTLIFEEA